MTLLAVVLSLVLATVPAQDPGTGTLRGQVRSEATGAPLSGAVVEATGDGFSRTVLTDAGGRYLVHGVPAGRHRLRATHLGHERLELEVALRPGGDLSVDFALRLRPVPITAVVVRSRVERAARDTAAATLPALGLAGARVMESAPGIVELGFSDAPRGSPGQPPVDPSDVLFVRGVASDLKLVLLDGAPVYSPFHVGGLLDSFDAQLLSDATLYLGGAPARYDGGLSYILDLSTRAGRTDRFHSTGAVDMMSARATAEGGWGDRLRLLAGGRGVHGLGVDPFVSGRLPYSYVEGLGRVDVGLDDARTLTLVGFNNREGVQLDSIAAGQRAGWGNTALSLRFRGPLGGNDTELTAAYSAFEATLPTVNRETFPSRGETERFRLNADLARDVGPALVRYGASFDHLRLKHEVRSRPIDALPRRWTGAAEGAAAGAYMEAGWQPVPRVRLRGGLRGNLFLEEDGVRLAPRLSATFMVGERASLTAAAGRYHQYVRTTRAPAELRFEDVPDTLFLPTGLAVDQATHFNLALHQELEEGIRVGIEGFYKTFDGSAQSSSDRTQASGVDLWVRRDRGRFRGWLGYSLNWIWSMPRTEAASEQFAGRQLLNLGALAPLGRFGELEFRFAYGAGLPFSSIPIDPQSAPEHGRNVETAPIQLGSDLSSDAPLAPVYPSDPYLRLDVGLSRSFATRIGNTPVEIAPYVRVLNSLDRRDALFYWSDRDSDSSPRAVGALPMLPIVGVSWRF
jgi:hypothetical protein